MAADKRDRIRAQRQLARELREQRHARDAALNTARTTRLGFILDHPEVESEISNSERKELARQAGYASWGKANPEYQTAWSKYWYHDKDGE